MDEILDDPNIQEALQGAQLTPEEEDELRAILKPWQEILHPRER